MERTLGLLPDGRVLFFDMLIDLTGEGSRRSIVETGRVIGLLCECGCRCTAPYLTCDGRCTSEESTMTYN